MDPHISELIRAAVWLAGVAGAMAALWRLGGKRAFTIVKALQSLPEMIEGVRLIKEKILPNGGSSIWDAVGRLERMLVFADERHWAIAGDADYGVLEMDANGECRRVNRTVLKWTDLTMEDMAGHGWLSLAPQDDRAKLGQEFAAAVASCTDFYQHHRVRFHGGLAFVTTKARPIRNEAGTLLGYLATMRLSDNASAGAGVV